VEDPLGWVIVDAIVDILFGIDIFVSFFSAYYDGKDNLITDRKAIAKKYIRSWFLIDITAILPLSYILSSPKYNQLIRLARLPKLYRLVKMTK
jgi:potassium channel